MNHNCEKCKNFSWFHGWMWNCKIDHPKAELDTETGMVDCDYWEQKDDET